MGEMTSDMDTLREELSSHFNEIERKVGESRVADSSRPEVSSVDEDNLMGASESEARLLVIEKEIQEMCSELTALVADGSHDIPQSTLHGLYSLVRALSMERKNINLRKMKANQQEKALQSKICLLDVQIESIEKALKGVENKLEKIENPKRDSTGIPPRLQEEYANSRNFLHEMIDKLYPNDEGRMKDLLKDLTVVRFSGEGIDWVAIDRHYQAHVETLLRDSTIESKPGEPSLVRFCI